MDYIIGTIIQYGSDTIPDSWLLCDGSAVSRTTYAELFAVIGTTFGVGNGSTTFNLPDLRGKVGVGKSTDTEFNTLGKTGGEKTHTLTTNEMPSHKHKDAISVGGSQQLETVQYNGSQSGSQYYVETSAVGGGQAHNNIQPYQVTNYIIKALPITPEGTKISELNEATSVNDNDLLVVVDTTNDETKKITMQNLASDIYSNSCTVLKDWTNTTDGVRTLEDDVSKYKFIEFLWGSSNSDVSGSTSSTMIPVYMWLNYFKGEGNTGKPLNIASFSGGNIRAYSLTNTTYRLWENSMSDYYVKVIGYK